VASTVIILESDSDDMVLVSPFLEQWIRQI